MTEDIYKDAIVTLAKAKTGAERLEDPDASVTMDNPLCGDRVTLDVKIDNGTISEVGHRVRGCMLCEAAASMVGQHAVGTAIGEIASARESLKAVLEGQDASASWAPVTDFTAVGSFKSRHECVMLPFEALEKAVDEAAD